MVKFEMTRRPRLHALALAGVAAFAACSDTPSQPDAPDEVAVVVTASIGAPTQVVVNDSVTLLECLLTLQASATGPARGSAQWETAKFRFYLGPDRATPFDSLLVDANEISAGWGSSIINAGTAQTSQWVLSAGAPFALGGDLQYRSVGRSTSHGARFAPVTCGPTVPAGAAAPVVSNLQVSPTGGEMQPSDLITVSYSVTAPAGLWESVVTVVSGSNTARLRTRGTFQTADARTVKLRLPYGAGLGSPAQVSVSVTDSWLRSASAGPRATSTVVDHTPPQLLAVGTEIVGGGDGSRLSGQYGPGDSLKLWTVASDDNGLANLVWELGAPVAVRDSAPLQGLPGVPVSIPVGAGWSGAPALRVWVTDRAGNRSAVMESQPDSIRFFAQVNRPARSLTLPGEYRDVALDPVARRLYLAMDAQKRIVPVSLGTLSVGTPVELPDYATSLDLTLGRDSLVAALPGVKSIALVDLASGSVAVVPVEAPGLTGPHALRIGADGRVVAAMSRDDGAAVLVEIDRRTGATQARAVGYGAQPFMRMRRTPDRSRLALAAACVYLYRVADGTLGPCLGKGVRPLALDAQAEIYTMGEQIFSATRGRLFAFSQLTPISSSAPAPDGSVYLSSTRGLLRARPDGAVLDRSTLPLVYGDLLFLDGGATLVTFTNQSTYEMFVVDLR